MNVRRYCVMLFTVLAFAGVLSCQAPQDDQAIINGHLQTMAKAASERDSKQVMGFLHVDFIGNKSLRKNQMYGLMYAHFQRNPAITVLMTDVVITVTGDEATSEFKLLLTGGENIVPERLRWLQVALQWVRVDAEWKIREASWRDVGTKPE